MKLLLMEEERLESVNMGNSGAALIVVSSGGKRNELQGHSFSTLEPAKEAEAELEEKQVDGLQAKV